MTFSHPAEQQTWRDGHWWSNDGLRLHYRDYPGPTPGPDSGTVPGADPGSVGTDRGATQGQAPVILCLPGLTRTVRDFETLAPRLARRARVIVPEWRGRGLSGYARDPLSYGGLNALQDLARLKVDLDLGPVVAIGTGVGGVVAMMAAATGAGEVCGLVLNDVGPEITPQGTARMMAAAGRGGTWPTWIHAARALAELEGDIYPRYTLPDWLRTAKQRLRLTAGGRIVPDYDLNIAEPLRLAGGLFAGIDLWKTFGALSSCPMLALRGARSDMLSPETFATMAKRQPHGRFATIPDVGHAPTLEEAESLVELGLFLDSLAIPVIAP